MSKVSPSIAVVLLLIFGITLRGEDWPQWRGLNRDSVWSETGILESFPVEGLKVRWRAPVGWGYSSPVVAQGRVYITDVEMLPPKAKEPAPAKERVLCFDETTGKPLWNYANDISYPDNTFMVDKEGRLTPGQLPTPTLIVNSGKVYALGMLGQCVCFDARNGDVLWKKNLDKEYQVGDFAVCKASPLIENDALILFVGGKPNACVVALDKNSGKELWTALDEPVTNSSPIAITCAGKRQAMVWTQESVTALDPATGKTYWRVPLKTTADYVVSTPVFHKNLLLIGGLMLKLDSEKPAASVLWPDSKSPSRRILTNTSTPIFQGDHLFSARSSGHFVCLEASTGKQVWETDKVTDLKSGASIHPTSNGDSVFLYTDKGELIRAKMTPKGYAEISRTRLLEPTYPFGGRKVAWSPCAYANRHVFARNDKELVCASLAVKP